MIFQVKLKNIRRCVLMNYNPATKLVDMRHYAIRAIPVGLNKGTKKVHSKILVSAARRLKPGLGFSQQKSDSPFDNFPF